MADHVGFKMLKLIVWISILLFEFNKISCFFDFDEINELKYGVEISKVPVLFSETGEGNILHVSSKFGQLYQCVMPIRRLKEEPTKEESEKDVSANEMVTQALDKALTDKCFKYVQGWWTYKYCYKKSLEQFHESGLDEISGSIMHLGQFESETNWSNLTKKKPDKVLYHEQEYTNGSICDLTGKPRTSKIKLYCDEEAFPATISRIDEPKSCTYEVRVLTSALCELPWFKPIKNNKQKEITCAPALKEKQFNDYKEKEIERKMKEQERRQKELENSLLESANFNFNDLDAYGKIFNLEKKDKTRQPVKSDEEDTTKGHSKEKKDTEDPFDKEQMEGKPENLLADTMKSLLSAFDVDPDDMKVVSYEKSGDKVSLKGVKKTKEESTPHTHESLETLEENSPPKQARTDMDTIQEDSTSSLKEKSVEKASEESESEDKELLKKMHAEDSQAEELPSTTAGKPVQTNQALEKGTSDADSKRDSDDDFFTDKEPLEKDFKEGDIGEDSPKRTGGGQRYIGNIKDILHKARDRYKVLIDDKDHMEGKLSRRLASTKTKVDKHLEKLQRTMDNIKREQMKIKDKNKEETANNIMKDLKESMEGYQRKLARLEEKMKTIRDITRRNRQKFGKLFMDSDEPKDEDEERNKVVDALKTFTETMLHSMENEDTNTVSDSPSSFEGDSESETKSLSSEQEKGKESLSSVLERLGKVIKERLEKEDKLMKGESVGEETENKRKRKIIKIRTRKLSQEAIDKLMKDDSDEEEDEANQLSGGGSDDDKSIRLGKRMMKQFTKKLKETIKDKLNNAGIDTDGKLKVKVFTAWNALDDDGNNEGKTYIMDSNDGNQFKSILGNIFGGYHDQVQEEQRHRSLENNYNFIWGNNEEKEKREEDSMNEEDSSDDIFRF